jgi:ABC-2 type transport system ATP-binding protein
MIEIKHLAVSYGDHQVLTDASVSIAPGHAHGILGMNGAGKTTFFEAIYGWVKKQKGSCSINRETLHAKQIAYLEAENYFYPYITGREHIKLCSFSNPTFRLEAWNGLFRLPLHKRIASYSTGMKQKLALMGALATGRQVLILDEPFNGIDLESSETLYQIINHLKEEGKYIMISSHIMDTLIHTCDRISYLEDGRFTSTFEQAQFSLMQKQLRAKLKTKIQYALDQLKQVKK